MLWGGGVLYFLIFTVSALRCEAGEKWGGGCKGDRGGGAKVIGAGAQR